MSSDDLAARAAEHRPEQFEGKTLCVECSQEDDCTFFDVEWPCLVHELAAALATEQAARGRAVELLTKCEQQLERNLWLIEHSDHGDELPWRDVVSVIHQIADLPIKICQARAALAGEEGE